MAVRGAALGGSNNLEAADMELQQSDIDKWFNGYFKPLWDQRAAMFIATGGATHLLHEYAETKELAERAGLTIPEIAQGVTATIAHNVTERRGWVSADGKHCYSVGRLGVLTVYKGDEGRWICDFTHWECGIVLNADTLADAKREALRSMQVDLELLISDFKGVDCDGD